MKKSYVQLDAVKSYLVVGHNEDDTLITTLVLSAEETISNYLNRELSEVEEESGDLPEPIKLAVMMMVATSYRTREAYGEQPMYVTPLMSLMLDPYIKIC